MFNQPARRAIDSGVLSPAVGIVSVAGYIWLAPNVSGHGDSSELTLVLALNGVAHPTGYPLYTLFGHLFVAALHALGASWSLAANAWSASGAAVALALMHRLGVRLGVAVGGRPGVRLGLLALLPPALFWLNRVWVPESILAEVYSWHLAWVMAAALMFVEITAWLPCPAQIDIQRSAPNLVRRALGWGIVCGIGLAHHLTSVLVIVPLSVVLAMRLGNHPSRPRLIATTLAAAIVPLAASLWIYIRAIQPGPAVWMYLEPGWAGFWRHITAAQYRGALFRFNISPDDRTLLAGSILPFLLPGLAIVAALATWSGRAEMRRIMAAQGIVMLLQTAFALLYGVDDRTVHLLPPMALGITALVPALAAVSRAGVRWRRLVPAAVGALGVVSLVLSVAGFNSARRLAHDETGLDGMLHSMWSSIHEEQGIVIWNHDMHRRLVEYQELRGEKPGLEVLNLWTILDPARRRWFLDRHGFDPIGNIPLPPAAELAATETNDTVRAFFREVSRRINASSSLPVIIFDPDVPLVMEMNKRPPASPPRPAG